MTGKVLIVDDVATNRIVFKSKLCAAHYGTLLAADGASALRLAREERPDAILLDLMLPDLSGIEVLERLRADPITARIPVVMFSASPDPEVRIAALRSGADDFLTKPLDDRTLLARLRSLLRGTEALAGEAAVLDLAEPAAPFEMPGHVALVARPATAVRLGTALRAETGDRISVISLRSALEDDPVEGAAVPDVFVIEADVDGPGSGLRLVSDLRSRPHTRHAAILILRAEDGPEDAAMAFDLGANDTATQDTSPRELAVRLRGLVRRKRAADRRRACVEDGLRMAVQDPLTGLHNRRYAQGRMASIAARSLRSGLSYAVLVVDLDHFKSVNDRYGHAAGDAVLAGVARRLSAALRGVDLLARVGGEEFLAVLPDLTEAEARGVAERVCRVIMERGFDMPGGGSLRITASVGVAVGDGTEPPQAVVDRADHALLHAKSTGRNRVHSALSAA